MDIVPVFFLKGVAVLLLLLGPLMVSCDGNAFSAVQGVVYCKPCKYQGVETVHEASPLPGAAVRLECKDIKNPQTLYATTDTNGYFFIHPLKNVAPAEFDQCQVFLMSPPKGSLCDKATDFHGGQSGAYLGYTTGFVPKGANFSLFTVGPFAFEPSTCPR